MDPVGSWSAYAASYNRLANTGGIQNGPSSELLGSTNCGQGVPSSTPQLLLQAHAGSTMPTASPFTSTGFLSPPPVAYDGVFTPIFHQKAHYGSFHQPRSSFKQSSEQDYSQLAPVSSNFFDQPTAWSQSNPQLPSPFGILPHESVIPDGSAKPYDNVNPHVQLQSLNQHNPQINTAFAEPKKQTQFVSAPKTSPAFFQQPVISDSSYKHNDYSPRFSYGHIQQPCALQAAGPPKEYRVPHSSRILFDHSSGKTDYGLALQKLTSIQGKKGYDSSERGLDSDCQSSPISYAMMDTQRGFQSTKSRPQQYQVNDEQSCRFNSDPDYHRKTNENYSPSESSDCVGVTRRSPSGHSASPVYPMYNSPMTTISSPSPNQHDVCYNKQTSDATAPPPLDVSLPHSNIPFSSVITRSEKNFIDDRFDRDDLNKHQWDERQRRYGAYEVPNIQRPYEEPNQVCLQDLSSCRGDPMSLVKTLQQQVPDKYPDDRMKRTRMNQEPSCPRIPPPAHHNANNLNQNGYFEFDRWNISTTGKVFSATPVTLCPPQASSNFSSTFTGQHHQPQSTALVVPHHGPPISYLPAFHLPQTQPTAVASTTPSVQSTSNSCPNSTANSNPPPPQPEPLPLPPPPPLPITTPPQLPPPPALSPRPLAQDDVPQLTPSSPQNTTKRSTVVVPDIEDELSFLIEESESEDEIKNKVLAAPNSSAKYQDTYNKFIEGKKDSSPKLNSRPVKKSSSLKVKQINENKDVIIKKTYPSDPLDDPRYYPHPKSVERSFETSESEKETFSNDESKNKKENDKKKVDKHHQASTKSSTQENLENIKETNKPCEKTTNKDSSTNNNKELEIVSISESSDSSEPKLKKTKLPKQVLKSNWKSQRKEASDTSNNSDTDTASKPSANDDNNRMRRLRKKVKLKNKKRVLSRNNSTSPSSSSGDYSDSEKSYKPQKVIKKKFLRKIIPTPEPLKKKFVTVKMLSWKEVDSRNPPASKPTKKATSNETNPKKKSNTNEEANQLKIRIVPQEKLINKTPATINTSSKVNRVDKTDFPFEVGDYLLSSTDAKRYFPPIWRVKDHLMLHKFLHFVNTGDSLYISVPFYTAWSSESPVIYQRVKVENVSVSRREAIVRLQIKDTHKMPEGCNEETIKDVQRYRENFEVYMRALISQVLDSNFLLEIVKEKDQHFLSNIGKIDDYCLKLKQHLKLTLNWNTILYAAIEKLPSYKTSVTVDKCFCGRKGNIEVTLEGEPYHELTLEINKEIEDPEVPTVLCNLCFELYQVLHKISHFKLYIYALCVHQVNFKRAHYSRFTNVAVILNDLLGDNDWLSKIFFDTCKFWGYITKTIHGNTKK